MRKLDGDLKVTMYMYIVCALYIYKVERTDYAILSHSKNVKIWFTYFHLTFICACTCRYICRCTCTVN